MIPPVVVFNLGRGGVPRVRPVAGQLSGTPLSVGLTIIARLLNAAAKSSAWTFTATTRARAQLTLVQQRRTIGW